MTKFLLFILALPAFPILLRSVHAINKMSHKTCDVIRWAYITIAIGSGAEIMAFFSAYSMQNGTWTGIKTMLFGAFCINVGYAILHIYKSPGRGNRHLPSSVKEFQ